MDKIKHLVHLIFAGGAVSLVAHAVIPTMQDPLALIGAGIGGLVLILGGNILTDCF